MKCLHAQQHPPLPPNACQSTHSHSRSHANTPPRTCAQAARTLFEMAPARGTIFCSLVAVSSTASGLSPLRALKEPAPLNRLHAGAGTPQRTGVSSAHTRTLVDAARELLARRDMQGTWHMHSAGEDDEKARAPRGGLARVSGLAVQTCAYPGTLAQARGKREAWMGAREEGWQASLGTAQPAPQKAGPLAFLTILINQTPGMGPPLPACQPGRCPHKQQNTHVRHIFCCMNFKRKHKCRC